MLPAPRLRCRSDLHALERAERLSDLVDFFLTGFLIPDRLLEQGRDLSDADESLTERGLEAVEFIDGNFDGRFLRCRIDRRCGVIGSVEVGRCGPRLTHPPELKSRVTSLLRMNSKFLLFDELQVGKVDQIVAGHRANCIHALIFSHASFLLGFGSLQSVFCNPMAGEVA